MASDMDDTLGRTFFKKKSAYDLANYIEIQLISQISRMLKRQSHHCLFHSRYPQEPSAATNSLTCKNPTLEGYLLYLINSDLVPCRVAVMRQISDHNMVLDVFRMGVPETLAVRRMVYDYYKASWAELRAELQNVD